MATRKSNRKSPSKRKKGSITARRKKLPLFRRSKMSFLVRFGLGIFAAVFLLPAILLLIYRIEAVHPVSTLMIRDGMAGPGAKREWIDFEDISPVLYQSVMMSEDGRFCFHNGIDWNALNQVIDDAIDGERTRGASTVTMQLVKNLFLWPNRSFVRKGLEIPYALMAEAILGKQRIMEIYLNIAEWDEGVFGIQSASRRYFNRSARKLGPRHSALLAVTLPNPRGRNPAKPSRRMNALAGTIRARARASGAYIGCLEKNQ